MILRRQYIHGRKYGYYFHPEIQSFHELCEFSELNTNIDTFALDNATYFFDEMSNEEQEIYWKTCVKNVMTNTRWVLDNLDNVCEFKVRWNYYGYRGKNKRLTVGIPPSRITKQCDRLYNTINETFINPVSPHNNS